MLIGPAAARPGGQSNGVGGYADIFNMQTMTIPSLAFAAAVVGAFRGYNDDGSLLVSCRHAMPLPPSQHVIGHSKATYRGSTTWYFISGSSRPLNPGRERSSDHFSYGGIGAWLYLSNQKLLSDGDTTAWSSRIFVEVFTQHHLATPPHLVQQPQ